MQEIQERDFINQIKDNQITPYNVYNYDVDYSTFFSSKHYLEDLKDDIQKEQKLNILFFDIECWTNNAGEFPKADQAKYPIVSNTIYSTFEKCYESFFLLQGENMSLFPINEIEQLEKDFKKYLLENEYIDEDETIKINLCNSEQELIINSWQRTHEIDPSIISGFNCHAFDLSYMYHRLMRFFNNDKDKVASILSKFNNVKTRKFGNDVYVDILDYPVADLRKLYVPRDEGGSNYGKKQAKYSLDVISSQELKLKKLEYSNDGTTIDNFYKQDPVNYLLYNIIDVILCKKLNQKLQHIELHNMIRRIMKVSFSSSMRGSSVLFDNFVFYELTKQKKYVRFGIIAERKMQISEEELKLLPRPKIPLVKKENVTSISQREFTKILFKYPGAYVKEPPKNKFVFNGLIGDLDASLPYWEKIFIKRDNKVHWGQIGEYKFCKGDQTLTWDHTNESCWKEVLGKTEHQWKNDLIKITTETGKEVTVTSNHSIYGIKKGQKAKQAYEIDSGKLEKGDYVVGFKNFKLDCEGLKESLNPELLGFWLSDGWANSVNVSYYIAKQDKELLEIFEPNISNIRMKRKASIKYKEEWVGTIQEPIRTELKNFYVTTKKKNFLEILNYTKEQRKRIWNGMMFADGTLTGLNQSYVVNPTEKLCKYRPEERNECFIVAHTIGWKPINNIKGNGISNSPTRVDKSCRYGLNQVCPEVFKTVYGACSILQKNNMSANCRHTLGKIKTLLPHVTKIYTNSTGLELIKKIEVIKDYEGIVYDISVKDTERFFAGTGIGAHNTALYPSMIRQQNISFNTFYGKILDPVSYRFIKLLQTSTDQKKELPTILYSQIAKYVQNYVKRVTVNNKSKSTQHMYFIVVYLIDKIIKSGLNSNQIFDNVNGQSYIILKKYFINLIDLISQIVDEAKEYNTFAHDYLLNGEINSEYIYIVENINETDIKVNKILSNNFKTYLESNNVSVSLSGSLFKQHEVELGLFSKFLTEMKEKRNEYKQLRDTFKKGEEEYTSNDRKQKSVKILMNTTYGLFGMAGFRYSQRELARAITIQSRLALKLSQFIGEGILNNMAREIESEKSI